MLIQDLTPEFVKQYFGKNPKKHIAYKDTVSMLNQMQVHSDGTFPEIMVGNARPGETDKIRKYRKQIYKSPTKRAFSAIITELMKIRKSEDWSIKYNRSKANAKLRENETLEDYCDKKFPQYESIEAWAFNVLLKCYLIDPNAVCFLMPMDLKIETSEYYEPYPIIYTSDLVCDYMDANYCVLYSTEKSVYKDADGKEHTDGDIYYCVNALVIQKWVQTDSSGTMTQDYEFKHELGYMPVFRLRALFLKSYDKISIFETRLSGAIPSFDEAVREYSDLQAEVVQHIHSLMWTYNNQKCTKCGGIGKILREGKDAVKTDYWENCTDCKGMGYAPVNPFEHIVINEANNLEKESPMPPAGYITKDTKIVEIQDKRVRDHVHDGMAALNMQFLENTPLSISGDAKSVDRDALNTFVSSIAEDIVRIMNRCFKIICDFRYQKAVPNPSDRITMLPTVNVPTKFDLVSSNYLLDELTKAKNTKTYPSIVKAIEIDYVSAKFNNDIETKNELLITYKLDPLPGLGDDDKVLRLQNGGLSKMDYIISCNITQFVHRAMLETESSNTLPDGFVSLDYKTQRAKMEEYAKPIIAEGSAAAKALANMNPGIPPEKGAEGAAGK